MNLAGQEKIKKYEFSFIFFGKKEVIVTPLLVTSTSQHIWSAFNPPLSSLYPIHLAPPGVVYDKALMFRHTNQTFYASAPVGKHNCLAIAKNLITLLLANSSYERICCLCVHHVITFRVEFIGY